MMPKRRCQRLSDKGAIFVTSDLSRFASAYEVLPEAYRNDDCLEFWVEDNTLCCRPMVSEIAALGSWVCFYNEDSDDWESWESKTNETN